MLQHKNFGVIYMLLVATIQCELVIFPYKVSGNCSWNVEAQKGDVALNANFNMSRTGPDAQLPMPSYQCLVTSYQYHVLYWWIAPEMDSLCV